MTGIGRLAAQRLPHARAGAVLRRHLLPARVAHGHAELARRAARRWPRPGTRQRDEIRAGGDRIAERLQGGARLRAVRRSRCERDAARRGGRGAARAASTPPTAASAARPSSRPRRRSSSCCAAASSGWSTQTLRAMASGGMYDQVGGGFARYSVDPYWLVPHFEKMLYDNALLARAYLHGWQVTGDAAVPARRRGDARLGAARDARPRGRLLLRARRRLRGRGGQVLRLERRRAARRACRRAGRRRGDRLVRRDRPRQLRGRQHPRARPGRARAPRRLAERASTRCARSASGRGSTTSA